MTVIIKGAAKTEKDIKPGLGKYSQDNPEFRRYYNETKEKSKGIDLKKLAEERRWLIKAMRFQGKTPKLVAKSAAIRAYMSEEING